MLDTKTAIVGTPAVAASRQVKELAFHVGNDDGCIWGETPTVAVSMLKNKGVTEAVKLALTEGDTLGDCCAACDRDTLGDGDGEVVGVDGGGTTATNVEIELKVYGKVALLRVALLRA